MKTQRYRYACTLNLGGSDESGEFEVEVSYEVAWGSPETPTPYLGDPALYDPGSPSIVEAITVEAVDGKTKPWGLGFGFIADAEVITRIEEALEDHEEAMILSATEEIDVRNTHEDRESERATW